MKLKQRLNKINQSAHHNTILCVRAPARNEIWAVASNPSSVILQEFSWGRFRITHTAFQLLIDSLATSVRFLEIVSGFGVKTSEDERCIYGFRVCSVSPSCSLSQHGEKEECILILLQRTRLIDIRDLL